MRFYYRNLLDKNNDYNILLPLGHVDNVETSDWHTIVTIGVCFGVWSSTVKKKFTFIYIVFLKIKNAFININFRKKHNTIMQL